MAEQEQTLWGIHAGRLGDADSLFLEKSVITIGWDELGDVSAIENSRDAYHNPSRSSLK